MAKFFRALKRSLRSIEKTQYEKRTGKIDFKYRFFDLYCGFMDTFVYSWYSPITVFYESVVRTVKWLPIVWKDRHWDHHFILEILKQKLRFQRECIGKYNRHTTAQEDCRQMRICELLLDRLQDPMAYTRQDWDEHYEKWPSRWRKCLENDDGSVTIPAPTEEEAADVRRIAKRENYMYNQDLDYFFRVFKKHHQSWWD
jgi:hypothetical protein